MRFLRTNTAVIITVGPFYDKTDGVTIKTALTITNERITLTADTDAGSAPTNILDNVTGATSGTANDLNYITGNDAGMMQMELAAADTNRLGRMFLSITDAANHVPVFHEFMVLPAMIYDAFVLGTDVLDASVTQWLGTAVSTPTAAGVPNVNAKTWNDLATVALPLIPTTAGRTLDVSAGGEAGVDWANVGTPGSTVNLSATTTNLVNTVTTYTGDTPQTGDSFARIGATGSGLSTLATQASVNTIDDFLDTEIAAILAAVDTEIAAIKAKTDLIPGTIDGKTFSELITLIAAVLLGKASGLATTTAVYRAVDDSKARVTATVDADGNRAAVTLDAA